MDIEEIDHTYFVSIHRELNLIEEHAWWEVHLELDMYKMEFRFLERFSNWVANMDFEDAFIRSLKNRFRLIWVKERKELAALLSNVRSGYKSDWKWLIKYLKPKLLDSKLVIKNWCEYLISSSMKLKPNEILILVDTLVNNIKDLLDKASNNLIVNDRFEKLEEKLVFMESILKLIVRIMHNKDFLEFQTRIHITLNYAACKTLLRWVEAADEDDSTEIELIISKILIEIKQSMPDAMTPNLSTLRYEGSTNDDIVICIDDILKCLEYIISYKAGEIETLEKMLVFIQNFLKLSAYCENTEEFRKFMIYVHDFSENAASLTFLYWKKSGDEEFSSELSRMVSDIIRKIEPCTPDVTALYFGILKAMKLPRSDIHLLGQTVVNFVDLLLENMVSTPLKDDFQILHEELIFVLTFLADRPIEKANDGNLTLVLKQIDVVLRGGNLWSVSKSRHRGWHHLIWHRSSKFDVKKTVFSEKEVHNFQRDIETVNAKIRRLYCEFEYSSCYDFPKIIGRGFLDILIRHLGNFKEKLIEETNYLPFAKKTILKIEEEFVSPRPFFNDILDMQKNQKELSDTRLLVINLAYLTKHVVNSCLVFDYPIWYHMAHLHLVLDRIKVVKTIFEKINDRSIGVLPCLGSSSSIKQAGASYNDQVVVGFEEEAIAITNVLLYGYKSLDIVSIVGMPGLGKTTLARKVFSSPSVKSHFHVSAFCSVSRDQNAKRLLHDILSNIIVIDDVSSMTKDELAHQLWKCLKGRMYLIVMDDIWEIGVWNEVKCAFPDDKNGSRVVFTTRFNKVATKAQIKSSPYHLGFLSDEKSWELLQIKVLIDEIYSPEYCEVGKLIAKNCKGLPLAVVVIAGLLARTNPSLGWWGEIAERIGTFLYDEGCMDMLEFSYKHLPEYLKPMLLYFGAFPEDMSISVKSLMLLWIDEGFVHESSLEDVAKDHLHDLIDRSLIMVISRSSNGGVKTVGIHNLVHDFCCIQARVENFFQLGFGFASSSSSSHNPIYNHYRVCMEMADESAVQDDATPTFPYVHSLLSFHRRNDPYDTFSIIKKLKLVQVLHLDNKWLEQYDLEHMTKLIHLRHIVAIVMLPISDDVSVPSSISNLWTLETFILRTTSKGEILLPETIWDLKWLRHLNVSRCKLIFPSDEHEAYSRLNNIESFSSPILSTEDDLRNLLKRLPVVRKLSCSFNKSYTSVDKSVETLDFFSQLESLNLSYTGNKSPYVIKFPTTLKKLKLVGFKLPWTAISDIEKLEHLEVLKLLWNSFIGPRWEMEDVVFTSLKFLKLNGLNLVRWNALPDSFPCLEQLLVIGCEDLVEIPSCFGEIPTLKRFEVHDCNKRASSCATQIKDDQIDIGNDTLEVAITNSY